MDCRYFFYLALCYDGSLYAGITKNLTRREQRHNQGTGAKYTSTRRPVVIVYSESFPSRKRAAARERQVKRWNRKQKIWLIGRWKASGDRAKKPRKSKQHGDKRFDNRVGSRVGSRP
jgi:putative endonuclease